MGIFRPAETSIRPRPAAAAARGDLGGNAAQITIVCSTGTSPVAAVGLAESAEHFLDRV